VSRRQRNPGGYGPVRMYDLTRWGRTVVLQVVKDLKYAGFTVELDDEDAAEICIATDAPPHILRWYLKQHLIRQRAPVVRRSAFSAALTDKKAICDWANNHYALKHPKEFQALPRLTPKMTNEWLNVWIRALAESYGLQTPGKLTNERAWEILGAHAE